MIRIQFTKGFTLIESLISILLLVVVLTAGLSFFFNGDEFLTLASHKRMATEIANSTMEDLKAGLSVPSASDVVIGSLQANVSDGLGMTVTTQNVDVDNPIDGTDDCKQHTVVVEWREAGKTDKRKVELVTL